MSYDISIYGVYSGRTNHQLQLYVRRDQTDAANNRSSYAWELIAFRTSGSVSYGLDCYNYSVNVGGQIWNGCHSLDFRSTSRISLASGTTGWFGHDSNGNLNIVVDCWHGPASIFGTADPAAATFATDRIAKAPGAPGNPAWSAITGTTAHAAWTAASRGNSNIDQYLLRVNTLSNPDASGYKDFTFGGSTLSGDATGLTPGTTYYGKTYAHSADGYGPGSGVTSFLTAPAAPTGLTASEIQPVSVKLSWTGVATAKSYELQWSTNPSFSGASSMPSITATTTTVTGLTPGTLYYFRVRALNTTGNGAWSTSTSATTVPSTAPGMTVTPNVSGRSATVALTPPGGATGVTKYTVERRIGTGAATSTDTATNSLSVSGLTPGTTYQWRSSAWFGTYQSPWTNWTSVAQPNPNTNPGDYFDGSTAARGDLTFSWTGTANLSTSRANSVIPQGWTAGAGSGTGTGSCVIQRATGGRTGAYCARTLMIADATGMGIRTGMNRADPTACADVQAGSVYVGSIYVRPGRAQNMRAEIVWNNAAGVEIGNFSGDPVLVTSTTAWTRLTVTATAPAGTVKASVRASDVTGTGWSPWLGGEFFDCDDAMISLGELFPWFSGATPDDTQFVYDWTGAANASPSTRSPAPILPYDPLADPDCPPSPLPPTPPVIDVDCIDDVALWRRYALAIPADAVHIWSATLPTLVLSTQSNAERQVRIRYWANPDDLPLDQAMQGEWEAEQILTYVPPNSQITIDGVTNSVTAVVNGGPPVSGNRLLYGTGGVPATWPTLRCGVGYIVSMDVPLTSPSGNLSASAIVTDRM